MSVFTQENISTIPDIPGPSYPAMDSIEITIEGVISLLTNLNPNKASGPDKICNRFLKEFVAEIAPCLTVLFQASLNQGIIPNDWKKAFVVPIFKKGDCSSPANYRPISLTSVNCKLLEHIISSTNIYSHLDKYKILTEQQHGFRGRRSCKTQLIDTINDFVTTLNRSGQTDAIFLDISKAFDTVPPRLCCTLAHYGIHGYTLTWIKELLTGRSEQVVVNGKYSDLAEVTSGVPQGSVLGPLLLICYINDIVYKISSTIHLYADDTLIYKNIHTVKLMCQFFKVTVLK